MSPTGVGRACLVILLGLVVAACSSSPAPVGGANAAAGAGAVDAASAGADAGGGGGAAAAAGGGGGAAAGGDISKVDACKLLTPDEIHQAVGATVGQGVNQDSDIVKQCEWDSTDSNLTVGVTVRAFDPSEWQTIQAFPKATAVSGMGDAAYRNSPLTGDLSVKHDGYEIDMAVVNFTTMSRAQIDQATDTLMKLILSRT